MEDLVTVFPFWSWREKSGAVSPTARFKAEVLWIDLAGAKAAAEPIRREERTAVNFIVCSMYSCVTKDFRCENVSVLEAVLQSITSFGLEADKTRHLNCIRGAENRTELVLF